VLTVASRPKIRPNNTKPAEKKQKYCPGKFGGRTAADFGQKQAKKILYEKYEFSHDLLAFVSNCH
jgi:hypothetical protein